MSLDEYCLPTLAGMPDIKSFQSVEVRSRFSFARLDILSFKRDKNTLIFAFISPVNIHKLPNLVWKCCQISPEKEFDTAVGLSLKKKQNHKLLVLFFGKKKGIDRCWYSVPMGDEKIKKRRWRRLTLTVPLQILTVFC